MAETNQNGQVQSLLQQLQDISDAWAEVQASMDTKNARLAELELVTPASNQADHEALQAARVEIEHMAEEIEQLKQDHAEALAAKEATILRLEQELAVATQAAGAILGQIEQDMLPAESDHTTLTDDLLGNHEKNQTTTRPTWSERRAAAKAARQRKEQ